MSFYNRELDESDMWAGIDPPKPSNDRIMLDYYKLQDMTPEEKTAKSERLNAVFANILDQWVKAGIVKWEP